MCIVTYSPCKSGFIFTSSRDESIHRPTGKPSYHKHGGGALFYAKDLQKGGTWFAIDVKGQKLCCLLNAAQHNIQKNNLKSRGLIPIIGLSTPSHQKLIKTLPYVLISVDFSSQPYLKQTQNCGMLHTTAIKSGEKSNLWASNNLYENSEIEAFNKKWAGLNEEKSLAQVKQFHDECAQKCNSPVYKRKNADIMTVSTTTLIKTNSRFELHHQNRMTNKTTIVDFNKN